MKGAPQQGLTAGFSTETKGLEEDTLSAGIARFRADVNYEINYPLHIVCKMGNVVAVDKVVDPLNINVLDNEGKTPLHIACERGFFDIVSLLIEKGGDVNSRTTDGATPLHAACFAGMMSVVEYLISQHADVRAIDHSGATILHKACESGNTALVELLITSGLDVNAVDENGETPLQRAYHMMMLNNRDLDESIKARYKHFEMIQYLVEKGGDNPNIVLNAQQVTLLHLACSEWSLEMINALIKRPNIRINAVDQWGQMPLHIACRDGNLNFVKCLIEVPGIALNALNSDGYTPIALASGFGYWEVVKYLSDVPGIDLNLTGPGRTTLIERACTQSDSDLGLVKFLVDKGIHVDVVCEDGSKLLFSLCEQSAPNFQLFAILAESKSAQIRGVDTGRQSALGYETLLHVACRKGHIEIVKFLIAKGADVNAVTLEGLKITPLHVACIYNHVAIVEYLSQQPGIELNALDGDGRSPLQVACRDDRVEVVKYLCTVPGVDLTLKDSKGKTPLQIACNYRHPDVVRIVLAHSPDLVFERDDDSPSLLFGLANETEIQKMIDDIFLSSPARLSRGLASLGVLESWDVTRLLGRCIEVPIQTELLAVFIMEKKWTYQALFSEGEACNNIALIDFVLKNDALSPEHPQRLQQLFEEGASKNDIGRIALALGHVTENQRREWLFHLCDSPSHEYLLARIVEGTHLKVPPEMLLSMFERTCDQNNWTIDIMLFRRCHQVRPLKKDDDRIEYLKRVCRSANTALFNEFWMQCAFQDERQQKEFLSKTLELIFEKGSHDAIPFFVKKALSLRVSGLEFPALCGVVRSGRLERLTLHDGYFGNVSLTNEQKKTLLTLSIQSGCVAMFKAINEKFQSQHRLLIQQGMLAPDEMKKLLKSCCEQGHVSMVLYLITEVSSYVGGLPKSISPARVSELLWPAIDQGLIDDFKLLLKAPVDLVNLRNDSGQTLADRAEMAVKANVPNASAILKILMEKGVPLSPEPETKSVSESTVSEAASSTEVIPSIGVGASGAILSSTGVVLSVTPATTGSEKARKRQEANQALRSCIEALLSGSVTESLESDQALFQNLSALLQKTRNSQQVMEGYRLRLHTKLARMSKESLECVMSQCAYLLTDDIMNQFQNILSVLAGDDVGSQLAECIEGVRGILIELCSIVADSKSILPLSATLNEIIGFYNAMNAGVLMSVKPFEMTPRTSSPKEGKEDETSDAAVRPKTSTAFGSNMSSALAASINAFPATNVFPGTSVSPEASVSPGTSADSEDEITRFTSLDDPMMSQGRVIADVQSNREAEILHTWVLKEFYPLTELLFHEASSENEFVPALQELLMDPDSIRMCSIEEVQTYLERMQVLICTLAEVPELKTLAQAISVSLSKIMLLDQADQGPQILNMKAESELERNDPTDAKEDERGNRVLPPVQTSKPMISAVGDSAQVLSILPAHVSTPLWLSDSRQMRWMPLYLQKQLIQKEYTDLVSRVKKIVEGYHDILSETPVKFQEAMKRQIVFSAFDIMMSETLCGYLKKNSEVLESFFALAWSLQAELSKGVPSRSQRTFERSLRQYARAHRHDVDIQREVMIGDRSVDLLINGSVVIEYDGPDHFREGQKQQEIDQARNTSLLGHGVLCVHRIHYAYFSQLSSELKDALFERILQERPLIPGEIQAFRGAVHVSAGPARTVIFDNTLMEATCSSAEFSL